ncbi:MAG: PRC-barrel domain-containing protein, partial [Nitrospirota bacterium]|nr:PRC-barrel domain-containing protein [Nitrospirota bacterium]
MQQPKLKSKVQCADREVGEVTKVILDPITREISDIVVGSGGGGPERQVPMAQVQAVTDGVVQLRITSSELAQRPPLKRDD